MSERAESDHFAIDAIREALRESQRPAYRPGEFTPDWRAQGFLDELRRHGYDVTRIASVPGARR